MWLRGRVVVLQPEACFPRTDHLLPTPSIPDLPASSLTWILPQPSVFDHEFRLFPPGYAPARLCGYTAHHWTCLPARMSNMRHNWNPTRLNTESSLQH
ncbi:unnamed protein product [Pleuronectes platessa]|uniref:Uncharacterized protein n=1 Tax=Pleuronectes platessa TaxID=8262 RepID=A0A9N7ZAH2_PLEPL|nr:unnamed protein product [Pleuronectes platessa]